MAIKPTKLDFARIELARRELARRKFITFVEYTFSKYETTQFHKVYADILQQFIDGDLRKLIITVPPQHGKQLCIDTPVLTSKGWKTHGALLSGDYVFHPSGKPIKVLNNIPQSEPCTLEFTFSDGSKIRCHENHEWTVIKGRRKTITLEANQFLNTPLYTGEKGKRGSRFIYQLPFVDCLQFDTMDLHLDPYCLGAWLGDGGSSAPVIYEGAQDFSVLNHFDSLYSCSSYGVHKGTTVKYKQYTSTAFHTGLKYYCLLDNKHIPLDFLLCSKEQRLQLLAGLIDTDGSLHAPTGQYRFINTNKKLIDGVCMLLKSLGYTYSLTSALPRSNPNSYGIQDKQICYQIGFTPLDCIPCKIPRKQSDKKPLRRRISLVAIRELSKHEYTKGNCIHVDSADGLYLAGSNLIPTHNSELATRRLPGFLVGKYPDKNTAIVSYSTDKARRFGRDIKRVIEQPEYKNVFPHINLPHGNDSHYTNSADMVDIPNKDGQTGHLFFTGRGGGLTGETVDFLIMDDLYKNAAEANSPVIRQNIIDWYDSVADSRLNNNSRQLIVFTRWHDRDLVGYIKDTSDYEILETYEQLENPDSNKWYILNFEALKTSKYTELDPREPGQPLYPEKHSKEKLEETRQRLIQNEPEKWEGMYQGNPKPLTGLLYGSGFKVYQEYPEFVKILSYTDVADTGKDRLCSITFGVGVDNYIYVLDIYYTSDSQEITEEKTAEIYVKFNVNVAHVESNAGGRAFARNVERIMRKKGGTTEIRPFHQSNNKESRIITNAATAMQIVMMPYGWINKHPYFARDVLDFKKLFKANEFDDAPDAITGCVEFSGLVNDEEDIGLGMT